MRKFIVIGFLLAAIDTAVAKDLYVDVNHAGCSDSTTYANNTPENPWCSIGRAAWGSTNRASPVSEQAAAAGDVVYVAQGVYTVAGTGNGSDVAYNPANDGTAENLITFQGVGSVELRLSSGSGPIIGALSKDYISWVNFFIDEANAPSYQGTGPVVVRDSIGSRVQDCTLDGNGTVAVADNHAGIYIETTRDVVLSGNTIYQFFSDNSTSHNGAGVMTYDTDNIIIEYNHIYETGAGIYVKGDHAGDGWPQQYHTIRYNIFDHNTSKGVLIYDGLGTKVYQNVFVDNESNIKCWGFSGTRDVYIVNNTIISNNVYAADNGWSTYGDWSQSDNVVVWNNVFYGSLSEVLSMGDSAILGDQSIEHNVYFGFDTFGSLNGGTFNFSTWLSTHGQDASEPASINQNPLLSNPAAGDYTLQSGSPAATLGVDVLNLLGGGTSATIPVGAYISDDTCVGAGCTPTVAAVINFNQAGSLQFNQTGTVNFNQ